MGAGERSWLDVPFDEKDEAKAAGARWDPQARRWYAPRPDMPSLARWAALPDIPEQLPSEDRTFGTGLFIDLIPTTCWFTHVRSCVEQRDWERIRRMVTGRAGHQCEVCGAGQDRLRKRPRWLEVHERWDYDDERLTQTLRRLSCLCTDCHTTTHFGLAQMRGLETEAFAHLRAVTGMSELAASEHVASAFQLWRWRSQREWTLDLRMLTEVGVSVRQPPAPEQRASVAHEHVSTRLPNGAS